MMPTMTLPEYEVVNYMMNMLFGTKMSKEEKQKPFCTDDIVKKVVFVDKTTIVQFTDGSEIRTVCNDADSFSKEMGVVICLFKKLCPEFATYREITHLVDKAIVVNKKK